MTASGSQHPLAFFADIFLAGLATVACIAGYLTAAAVVSAVRQWWRGRKRRPRLQDLMDDGDGQGGVPPLPRRTRPYSLGDLVQPDGPDPAKDCRYCGLPFDPRADCMCTGPCGDRDCGWLQWLAVSNTDEQEADW